jgi:hypothetical protein
MLQRTAWAIMVSVFMACSAAQAAAAKAAASKAGTGEPVKTWASKTLEQATAAKKPILLYIYDAVEKKNDTATFMEGAKFLGDADVKTKEKDFLCIKIKSTDGSGFAHDWMQMGDKGAALLVISADMKLVQSFSKSTRETNSAENLQKAMDAAAKAAAPAGAGPKAANNDKNNKNGKNNPNKHS